MEAQTQKILNYFMWGYQDYYRDFMERRAETVLAELGVNLKPTAMLVGVRVPEETSGHPVCVEPEEGEIPYAAFASCHTRSEAIFNDHPDHRIMYGDAPSMRDKPEIIRRKSVMQAIREVVDEWDATAGTRSFVGSPTRLDRYFVAPLLRVPAALFETFPRLEKPFVYQHWTSATGIVDNLLLRLLDEASRQLSSKDPGRFHHTFPEDEMGLLRDAARGMCNAIQLAIEDLLLQDIFESLNMISSLRYEGGEARGEIVFLPAASEAVHRRVQFLKPVPLDSYRLARKMVEMSGEDLACICHGRDGLVGLGTVKQEAGSDPVFRAVFHGHYRWDFFFRDLRLMTCHFGVPRVPPVRLSREAFVSNARRVLVDLGKAQACRLWDNVEAAMGQGHGTLLVVTANASAEATRLRQQSIPIEPVELTPELVTRISGIDGAILVDRDSRCHAIGVILDGLASEGGDPSRGARFNSAVRYIGSADEDTLCLVVSEDGQVDMVPTLRPQVGRDEIQSHVEQLTACTNDNYFQVRNWLHKHRFYLTAEQCEIVNREIARIDAEPRDARIIWITFPHFMPDPEMNETYYRTQESE